MTYEERKALYIARATRHFDTPKIRKEASEKFDQINKKDVSTSKEKTN